MSKEERRKEATQLVSLALYFAVAPAPQEEMPEKLIDMIKAGMERAHQQKIAAMAFIERAQRFLDENPEEL